MTILHPLVYVAVAVCGLAILGWFVIFRREHLDDLIAFGRWIGSDEQPSTPSSPLRYTYGCECEQCACVRSGHVATNVRMAARSFSGPAAKGFNRHTSSPESRRLLGLDAIVRGSRRVN